MKRKEVSSETSAFVQYESDIELMSYYVLVLLLFCTFLFVWICVCWECLLLLERKKHIADYLQCSVDCGLLWQSTVMLTAGDVDATMPRIPQWQQSCPWGHGASHQSEEL